MAQCLQKANGHTTVLETTGTEWVCLNVCGTPIRTSMRTLRAFPGTFFAALLDLPGASSGTPESLEVSERGDCSIDLDFSIDAVQVLLATLRAARSSVNLAFRAVQNGLAKSGVEVVLLFDYVGLSWLLPTHLPSEFDSSSSAMSARFEHFDFSSSSSGMDISGVLHFIHVSRQAPTQRTETQFVPFCAVVQEDSRRLDLLEVADLVARDSTWSCGKFIYMPLTSDRKLVLDLGPRRALYPTGMLLWIHPPPQGNPEVPHARVRHSRSPRSNRLHPVPTPRHASLARALPDVPNFCGVWRRTSEQALGDRTLWRLPR